MKMVFAVCMSGGGLISENAASVSVVNNIRKINNTETRDINNTISERSILRARSIPILIPSHILQKTNTHFRFLILKRQKY